MTPVYYVPLDMQSSTWYKPDFVICRSSNIWNFMSSVFVVKIIISWVKETLYNFNTGDTSTCVCDVCKCVLICSLQAEADKSIYPTNQSAGSSSELSAEPEGRRRAMSYPADKQQATPFLSLSPVKQKQMNPEQSQQESQVL